MSRYPLSSAWYHNHEIPPSSLIESFAIPVRKSGIRISSLPASHTMSTKTMTAVLNMPTSTTDDPPPPYGPDSSINPGFCEYAFRERVANRVPGGGMTGEQYFSPCKGCSFLCGDEIPSTYKTAWPEWIDPSVNFRWESHIAVKEPMLGGLRGEMLSCWICWEYEQTWVKPMVPEDWYAHMRKHFRVDGYRSCKGKTGAMQRRRNCRIRHCPKLHS